jgi:Bacterial regulatory helix-turn-helix protein, lysR family
MPQKCSGLLFDHLIGSRAQRRRHVKAERLAGFEVGASATGRSEGLGRSRSLAPRFFHECLGLLGCGDGQFAWVEETDLSEYTGLIPIDMLVPKLQRLRNQPGKKLSRHILQLEERLGVRLLNRSSRRFSVTEIGREFYDRCLATLVEAEAAEQMIAQVRAEPRGVVRMRCPIALIECRHQVLKVSEPHVAAQFADWRQHHPCALPRRGSQSR